VPGVGSGAGADGVDGWAPGNSPILIVVDPASRTRWSGGAPTVVEAAGTRGGEFAFGIGEAAGRGLGEPGVVVVVEAADSGRGAGRVAATARDFARRGAFPLVAGTVRDFSDRAGSVVAVASGGAAAWIRGPAFGGDVGESGTCAAQGEGPWQESSKATTMIDGQADRPIIPFPSPTRA
jgi:hypothetical protein